MVLDKTRPFEKSDPADVDIMAEKMPSAFSRSWIFRKRLGMTLKPFF
jgi:hypothetical protein